jgi:magnesium transporter
MSLSVIQTEFNDFIWVDYQSPSREDLEAIASQYHLDYFTVINCLESGHLPKIEFHTDYNFVVLRAYSASQHQNVTTVQALSDKVVFFYSDHFLVTIHRDHFVFLNEIRDKHCTVNKDLKSVELITKIFYQIIKTFKEPAEWQSQQMNKIEDIIFLEDLSKISLENLYYQKTETRISKKLLLLSQDVVNQFQTTKKGKPELRFVQDLLTKLILEYDEATEDAHNLMHTYLSVASQKNNDIMKLLTIFSMFFLPLTFIVGLYGMNFDYMPELHWRYGYFLTLFVMVAFSGLVYYWFKRKKVM